ncbi:serine/threonine protein kinase [Streptosporangium becharense]|uniref:Serine/threonine protein kinase n=1 Tax=Streptosporangium becharense TaxID=1816182 RepID=A0A7W9IHQ4_9ACTN|nr:lipopolysaccharide kinase InaA family protein [Streptosporangium becharense]MBB2912370.1 serine/threonine protein kinase [Streptosporangium becharense]MBB5820801.1 serine/threonine protein kinase [Streptosporangium becharense]
MTSTAEAIALVTAARTPADLFGDDSPRRAYRRLARLLHPDLAPGPEAAAAFTRLAALWAAHGGAEERRSPETVITTRRGTYRIGRALRRGATAVLYESGADTLLKIPRSHTDNDLMRREADALTAIARDGDPRLLPYVPRLVESFRHRSAGVERRANVISRVPDGFLSLAEISRRRPVLDPRDVAWIWRRLLVAIGAAHRAGIVHGAVFGHHVLVHPIDHGLVLVDWSQSVPVGTPITALVARHQGDYPPEVLARRAATPATDIRLATRCVAALMGGHPPGPIRRFVRGSLLAPPGDAWSLLAELDELLDDEYGPRKYRPLHL